MALSELLKECLLIQDNLEFVNFGRLPIVLYTDATVARAFAHRTGVGRLKHLDVRYMCVQELFARGTYALKKVPRSENPADMLTHAPSSQELAKFNPMMGLFPSECSKGAIEMTKAVLRQQPSFAPKLAAIILAASATGARGESSNQIENTCAWTIVHILKMIVFISVFGKFYFGYGDWRIGSDRK